MYSGLSASAFVPPIGQPAAPAVQPTTQIPGVRGGTAPAPANPAAQPAQQPTQATVSLETLQAELEGFKPKVDNAGNPVVPAAISLEAPQIPKLEQFKDLSQKLAGQVQIDQAKLGAALGGDASAFAEVLQSAIQQSMQHTLALSTQMAGTLAHNQASLVAKVAQAQVADTATEQASIDAAVAINPQLGTNYGANVLKSQIKELRRQYPTAPAELLGKFAAAQVAQLSGQPAAQDDDFATPIRNQAPVDWASQFGL